MSEVDVRGRPITRPWCCPEPRCRPLYQLLDSSAQPLENPQPGQSWNCYGLMTEAVEFSYDGVEHSNDLRECAYTALKGVIMFQPNVDDWVLSAGGYVHAIEALRSVRPEGVPVAYEWWPRTAETPESTEAGR